MGHCGRLRVRAVGFYFSACHCFSVHVCVLLKAGECGGGVSAVQPHEGADV